MMAGAVWLPTVLLSGASLTVALIWGDRTLRVASLNLFGLALACQLIAAFAAPFYQLQSLLIVEAAGLALFLRQSFQADRWFPLALAALALIGLTARGVQLLSVVSSKVELLTLPNAPGAAAAIILLLATARYARRHHSIAPKVSLS